MAKKISLDELYQAQQKQLKLKFQNKQRQQRWRDKQKEIKNELIQLEI